MMRSSFRRYLGRMVAMLSVAAAFVVGLPAMDFAGSVSAQTKTAAQKKKGNSTASSQKKTTSNQKKTSGTSNNQKKGTQPQKSNPGKKGGSQTKQPSSQGKKQATQAKKQAARGSKATQGKKSVGQKSAGGPKSSAEAKKLQEAAQRDIQQTKEQLRLNEQQIKTGLSDLNRLSSEIAAGKTQVAGLQKKVAGLDSQISGLGKEITKNEGELKLMREEYLKAVKKMRLTKKNQSTLAFIFASENFNQAMRRIRYMRQFAAWKERKSSDIDKKIAQLGKERESLAKAKDAQTVALGQLTKSQAELEENHKKQETLVATLRQNGDALQAHLTAKQKEANKLKETISSLIAQEQAKLEAERKAREKAESDRKAKAEAERIAKEKAEAERRAAEKATEEKLLAEKAAAEKAAAEKAAAEKAAAEKAAEKALKEKIAAEKALAEKSAKEKAAAEKEAAEKAKAYKKAQEEKEKADRKFAEAKAKADEKIRQEKEKQEKKKKNSENGSRSRRDRRAREEERKKEEQKNVAVVSPKAVEKPVKSTTGPVNFASLRGSLARRVDGTWRITNPFGRHAMPEMPEIEYDNPGIDAEVAKGTTVKSVCGGKVSGVYKVAGYGTVVIVNHGDYYTVYGNLGSANVAVGTDVGGGSALGTAGSDPDDPRRGSVHFEVWKGREKQNPSSWLR
ncbi:MAG: peptidoglycan DD-metalloendopeptidase family protein [Muribaculaceae bacterium]|nr:peptidoglycan DD-metalloendopeptidase family protein [Muribaculaceae bacterium]